MLTVLRKLIPPSTLCVLFLFKFLVKYFFVLLCLNNPNPNPNSMGPGGEMTYLGMFSDETSRPLPYPNPNPNRCESGRFDDIGLGTFALRAVIIT